MTTIAINQIESEELYSVAINGRVYFLNCHEEGDDYDEDYYDVELNDVPVDEKEYYC